jgi:hypothetical protein
MIGEYKVSRPTRRCAAADRPLREGEWYFSVIFEDGDDYVRRDYAAENWKGPPEGAIGHWKRRMPTASDKKMVLAPPEVLVDLLRQMERFPNRVKSRYLLALMLLRRRILRPGSTTVAIKDAQQTDKVDDTPATSPQRMLLMVVSDGSEIEIDVCEISRSESESLRADLNELLYTEADSESDLDLDPLPDETKN